ncbi:MAG: hypothetical protein R2726_16640 [Acidimicrobiales bacterium]
MSSQTVAVVLVAAATTALCLWLLLRRGSMAHRAERDYPDEATGPGDADR